LGGMPRLRNAEGGHRKNFDYFQSVQIYSTVMII
jgi:hypothetical protein